MEKRTKITIGISAMLLTMLVIPLLAVKFAPADAGMALCFILFFAVIPLESMLMGILAGSDMPGLWWIPVVAAVAFPILFSIAVWDMVWELFWYSAIYLCIGGGSMLITHYGKRYMAKKK